MVRLLRDIAVDPAHATGEDNPLRQVVVNTYSPVVVENVGPEDLIYIDKQRIAEEASQGTTATLRVPPKTWRAASLENALPLGKGQLQAYLSGANSYPVSHRFKII